MEIIIFLLVLFFIFLVILPGLGALLGFIALLLGAGASRGSLDDGIDDEIDSDIEGGRP